MQCLRELLAFNCCSSHCQGVVSAKRSTPSRWGTSASCRRPHLPNRLAWPPMRLELFSAPISRSLTPTNVLHSPCKEILPQGCRRDIAVLGAGGLLSLPPGGCPRNSRPHCWPTMWVTTLLLNAVKFWSG